LLLTVFSLRVQGDLFCLAVLAVAEFMLILSEQWTSFDQGEDGVNFPLPDLLSSANASGRMVTYYLILVFCLFLFFLLDAFCAISRWVRCCGESKITKSAPRPWDYKTLRYKIVPIVIGSCIASDKPVSYMHYGYASLIR